uniref:Aldo/keto reductase n=1 Tax=uncultured Chloroflexota bacterium TaxID=166587 RepID=H5SM31_9CHLR|nr:aldo/keto reductase [uncultured Chloroflexota bacterium]
MMEYRQLGQTSLHVSRLCLGTMQLGWTADESTSFRLLSMAFDAGINFIDTADIYSRWVPGHRGGESETIIGKWWRKSGIPRSQIILATKVRGQMGEGPLDQGLSRAYILKAVEGSLRRLQTDYIDLYQTHWPDPNVPIEETLRAFDELIQQGKVRYIGCSNYKADALRNAMEVARKHNLPRFESLQPHYNLIHRSEFEGELAQVCQEYHLGVIPYSPLAAGFLSGKYRPGVAVESARAEGVRKYFREENWKLLDEMEKMAEQKGASISQLALAWLLHQPLVTSPIIGPRTPEQLRDNLGALNVLLTPQEIAWLNEWTTHA